MIVDQLSTLNLLIFVVDVIEAPFEWFNKKVEVVDLLTSQIRKQLSFQYNGHIYSRVSCVSESHEIFMPSFEG